MTEQVVAATRGRTVIAARCGDHALTPPFQGPGGAGAVRAGASRQSTGRRGEDLAATYLEDIGWQVLERNWRPDHGLRGELDTYVSMTRALVALLQDARLLDERRATELLAALLQ